MTKKADEQQDDQQDENQKQNDDNDSNQQAEGWTQYLIKGANRIKSLGQSLSQNTGHVIKNLVDGPATFVQGFNQVTGGVNEIVDGLDAISNWDIAKGAASAAGGFKKLPAGMINLGMGGLKSMTGYGALSAGLGGTGYLLKKAKDGILYKMYKQRQNDKAKKGLSQIAMKILETDASQDFQKRFKPAVDKVLGYTQSKLIRGMDKMSQYGQGIVGEIDHLGEKLKNKSENKIKEGYASAKSWIGRGGKFGQDKQKPNGMIINVEDKGNIQPQKIEIIHHKV